MSLDAEWAIQWVRRSAVVVQEHRDALTAQALDTAIGDGDHGANLERGYNAAVARLDEVAAAGQAPTTAGEVLQLVATSLITTVGGAAGPLLGTAMLRASHTVDGAQVDGAQVAQMLQEAADAVRLRGRAEAGDKTMLDAWQPAAAAARPGRGPPGCGHGGARGRAGDLAPQGAQGTCLLPGGALAWAPGPRSLLDGAAHPGCRGHRAGRRGPGELTLAEGREGATGSWLPRVACSTTSPLLACPGHGGAGDTYRLPKECHG